MLFQFEGDENTKHQIPYISFIAKNIKQFIRKSDKHHKSDGMT